MGRQSDEIGYCLIEPKGSFKLSKRGEIVEDCEASKEIRLPTGSMSLEELEEAR